MTRAHFRAPVQDSAGDILPGSTVSVYVNGLNGLNGTTPTFIGVPIYSDDSSLSTLSNPFVTPDGNISIYLDVPQRVDLGILPPGGQAQVYTDIDVDEALSSVSLSFSGTGPASTQVGNATASGTDSTAVGDSASAPASQSTALGQSANASASQATAAGQQATASGGASTALGASATASGTSSIALGASASAAGSAAAALGAGAGASYSDSTAVGAGAVTTAPNQVMIGTNADQVVIPGTVLAPGFGVDWQNILGFGADPSGGDDSLPAFIDAFAALGPQGGVIYVPAGIFATSGPILLPSGVEIRGSLPLTQSGDDISTGLGSVIRPLASWSQGAASPVSAAIVANGTYRSSVRDLLIDGSQYTATAMDGISGYGAVNALSITRVGIYASSGNGISSNVLTGSSFPDGWRLDTVIVQQAAGNGVYCRGADGTFTNVHAQSCGGDGFSFYGGANIRLVECRGDRSQNGFTFDCFPSGNYDDSITLIGCGSQRNQKNGLNLINSSTAGTDKRVPVIVSGCSFDGDGVNAGAGGGGFAGISVSGNNKVTISDTNVMVMDTDVSSGCPQYGLTTSVAGTAPGAPTVVEMTSGLLNYAAGGAPVNNAAPATSLIIGGDVLQATGYNPGTVSKISSSAASAIVLSRQPAGAVAATDDRARVSATSSTLTSGTLYVKAFDLPIGLTTQGCNFVTGSSVKTGGTGGGYVLLNSALQVVAVTANQTDAATVWGTANTPYPLNWTASYTVPSTGLYYVGVMVAETSGTMPTFFCGVALDTNLAGIAPVLCGSSSTGLSAPPALNSTVTAITAINSMNLYAWLI